MLIYHLIILICTCWYVLCICIICMNVYDVYIGWQAVLVHLLQNPQHVLCKYCIQEASTWSFIGDFANTSELCTLRSPIPPILESNEASTASSILDCDRPNAACQMPRACTCLCRTRSFSLQRFSMWNQRKHEKTAETFCKHNFHVVSTLIE
jgi:hypothetical protein